MEEKYKKHFLNKMPPTSNFGQDITNTTPNDGNNNNNNNNDSNGNGAGLSIINIERMGGTQLLPRLAGKGVIRVVGRCEDAKENNNLGELNWKDKIIINNITHTLWELGL